MTASRFLECCKSFMGGKKPLHETGPGREGWLLGRPTNSLHIATVMELEETLAPAVTALVRALEQAAGHDRIHRQ
jgi:hypothetical protein